MKLKLFSTDTVPVVQETRAVKAVKVQQKKHLEKVNALKETAPIHRNNQLRRIEPMFKTRKVELNTMKSYRLDHKTIIFLKPGADLEKVIKAYKKLNG